MVGLATTNFWDTDARDNLARLRQRVAEAWRVRLPTPPSEWCAREFHLSPEVEAGSGTFNVDGRPWWRDILDALIDTEVREVNVPAATQVGKTLVLVGMILWCASNAPAPAMVVTPDKDAAIELRDRVYANALESPTLRRLVPPPRQWNNRYIDLGTMRIYLAWSGSRQRLRGRRCKYVFLTEVDAYRGDKRTGSPVKAASERSKAFHRSFHFRESSPVEAPSEISDLETNSDDRRRWHAQCPHCGRYQELRFFTLKGGVKAGKGGIGGLQDDEGKWRTPAEARQQAHYLCEAGCRIDEDQRLSFVASGRWVAVGQRIDDKGKVIGPEPASRRRLGRHLWSIHSDTITFADLAAAYLEHRAEGKLPEFFGNWLGLSYQSATKVPTWEELGRRLAFSHARRTVPPECWFLTAGGDLQEDRAKVAVRGWAPGCTSFLIDWLELERSDGDENALVKSDLAQIEKKVLAQKWPIVGGKNPLGKKELGVRMFGMDANYRTLQVHEWFRSLPDSWTDDASGRVRLVRGDTKVDPRLRWEKSEVEESRDKTTKYEGKLQLWRLFVHLFYEELTGRLAGQPGQPGSWYVTSDALIGGKDYLREVVNFHRVIKIINGKRRGIWQPRSESIPNDYFDCEVYALVMAHMVVGDLGWSEDAWSTWWKRTQTQPARRASSRRADHPGIADR